MFYVTIGTLTQCAGSDSQETIDTLSLMESAKEVEVKEVDSIFLENMSENEILLTATFRKNEQIETVYFIGQPMYVTKNELKKMFPDIIDIGEANPQRNIAILKMEVSEKIQYLQKENVQIFNKHLKDTGQYIGILPFPAQKKFIRINL